MAVKMKRSTLLRSSSITELKLFEPELSRLGRTFNAALCIPLKRHGESAVRTSEAKPTGQSSVRRNCSAKALLRTEGQFENENPNEGTKLPKFEKHCKVSHQALWRKLAQRKLCWFLRNLTVSNASKAEKKAEEHRRVRTILSCLQEWKSVGQKSKQKRMLSHETKAQITALDSFLQTIRLADHQKATSEVKRQRSQSPSYFKRQNRRAGPQAVVSSLSSRKQQSDTSVAQKHTVEVFRRKATLYYYGLLPLKKTLLASFVRKENNSKVEAARIQLKRKVMNKWLEFYISQFEEVYKPQQHFTGSLQRRVLKAWHSQVTDPMEAAAQSFFKVRPRQLSFGARVFDAWRRLCSG